VRSKPTEFSEENVASNFTVEEQAKQETGTKQTAGTLLTDYKELQARR
jgi:hypothetical protein